MTSGVPKNDKIRNPVGGGGPLSERIKYSGELKKGFSPPWIFHDAIVWRHVSGDARAFKFPSRWQVSANGIDYVLPSCVLAHIDGSCNRWRVR